MHDSFPAFLHVDVSGRSLVSLSVPLDVEELGMIGSFAVFLVAVEELVDCPFPSFLADLKRNLTSYTLLLKRSVWLEKNSKP